MKDVSFSSIYFQAHRGGLFDRPENTMSAYKYSWNINGAIPEADIRTTADGIFICLHDKTLKRTVKAPVSIAFRDVKYLQSNTILNLDAGIKFHPDYKGEQIPLLTEVLEELRKDSKREIYLDIKNINSDKLKELIFFYNVEKQIIFVNGNVDRCATLLNLYKGAKTMTWLSGSRKQITDKYRKIINSDYRSLTQLQVHLHCTTENGKVTPDLGYEFLINAAKETAQNGIQLQVRPFLFDNELIRNLLSIGISWFAVDNPGEFSKTLFEINRL